MAIVINGSGEISGIAVGGLPDGIVDAGTLATNSVDSAELIDGAVDNSHLADDAVDSDEIAAGAIDAAHLASGVGGKVLQVVSVEKSDTFSTSSTSFVDITGLSVAITPSATSSKILVLADVGIASGTDGYTQNVRLRRDSTSIAIGDASSNRVQSTGNHAIGHSIYFIHSVGVNVLDTPATTSSVTYKFQLVAEAASTAYVNRPGNNNDNSYAARTASHITLMEIGA